VRVYAGIDPVTGRRHYLREIIPPGPRAEDQADEALARLLAEVREKRHPRTNATLNQLLDRHLEMIEAERTTLTTYRGYVDKHIRPLIGSEKIGAIDADILDSFYAELRRCRDHCRRRRAFDHRTERPHDCDDRCRRHSCKPLSAWTIRKIHFIISGAYQRAVRWKWVAVNPAPHAEPPSAPPPDPRPPNADEAARIVSAAWKDHDFGTLVWLAMTTGARRGELCGLRWPHFDQARAVLALQRSIAQDGAETWEKHTKTHQRRHVTLDAETVAILAEHHTRCQNRATALGLQLAPDAFIFAASPDGRVPLKPSSVTQRYDRLARRLGIDTTLHKLRHYSATELITAGVDIRTVAGRLGHAGGGTTTLRVYAAWVSEADQRAATTLLTRMPARPAPPPDPAERAKLDPQAPYEHIAATLRQAILDGTLPAGSVLPPVVQLAKEYGVAVGTAHRALTLLKDWGLVDASRGRRATILPIEPTATPPDQPTLAEPSGILAETNSTAEGSTMARHLLDLEVRRKGQVVAKLTAEADPKDARDLRQLLLDAVKRDGRTEPQIGEYEMDVRYAGKAPLITTFVATTR